MADARERGLRQKAYRQREKKRQRAMERKQEALSVRVAALQLERDQLQRAVHFATCDSQDSSKAASCKPTSTGDDKVVVTFCFGEATPQMQLTKGEVRSMTVYVMADVWKALVQKMSVSLPKVDAAPSDARLLQAVKDTVREAVDYLWALVLYHPTLLRVINTCSTEAPNEALPSCTNSRDWPAILACMQLTKKQGEQLLTCRRTILHDVSALIAEWDRQWAELQDMEDRSEGTLTNHMQLTGLTERLRTDVHPLHTCRAFYQSYAWMRTSPNPLEAKLMASYEVLSPVQVARYLVACYPMGPDTLSLMNFLAQKGGEPSAGDVMQDARPETAAGAQDMSDSFGSSLDWRDMLNGWPVDEWPELTNGMHK
ncbi:hypothetical protein WJX75_002163 [Coccomyxa subellipsoidea]|uniref:BZIP domain-containing protein n=1 Tax=Coccomyxa subellipsoidea TaxID=248742 RepID=A0ABR2YMD4_9CHLO